MSSRDPSYSNLDPMVLIMDQIKECKEEIKALREDIAAHRKHENDGAAIVAALKKDQARLETEIKDIKSTILKAGLIIFVAAGGSSWLAQILGKM